jgi:uncharacterized peroxidase-related enzyme
MAYIKVIDYPEANRELKEIYDVLIGSRGKLADVHKIQSLNAPTVLSHMNLYQDVMFGQSPLKRYQREMLAVVVSVANGCQYCINHHREALFHYWKDQGKIDVLITQPQAADIHEADRSLCQYARELTLNPQSSDEQKVIFLRDAGFDDRTILDATLVISYFNFVNRITLALGLQVEANETKGYNY